MVGDDDPVSALDQRWDEVAVDEPPRRVAMHEHNRPAICRPFVDVVHPAVTRRKPPRLIRPRAAEAPVDLRAVAHRGLGCEYRAPHLVALDRDLAPLELLLPTSRLATHIQQSGGKG